MKKVSVLFTFLIKQKKPRLISRDHSISLFPQSLSGGFSLSTSTHCPTNRFVCNFLSSSAGVNLCSCFFPVHLCLPLSLPTFSRPSIPRLIVASFPLSDPRCFGILSSASVLDSDYSAFRSFFSLLPVLPCRRFLRCFFPLPSGLFPCLPSDSGTQPPALLFSDHWLASQWLLQCLRLLPFGLRLLPLCFRFRFWLLSFRSYPYG